MNFLEIYLLIYFMEFINNNLNLKKQKRVIIAIASVAVYQQIFSGINYFSDDELVKKPEIKKEVKKPEIKKEVKKPEIKKEVKKPEVKKELKKKKPKIKKEKPKFEVKRKKC